MPQLIRASTIAVSPRDRACPLVWALILAGLCASIGCSKRADEGPREVEAVTEQATPPADGASCPREQIVEPRAPDVRPEHERAAYWLAKYDGPAIDAPLLDAEAIAALDAQVAAIPGGWRDPLGERGADPELVARELDERLAWLRTRVDEGTYVEREPGSFAAAAARVESAAPIEDLPARFVALETQLWCIPMTEGLFTAPVDLDFDRNRCASLHPGELVRTLREAGDGGAWVYVEAGHSVGWIDRSAGPRLGPALTRAEARARLDPPQAYVLDDHEGLRAGSRFALLDAPEPDAPEDPDPLRLRVPGVDGSEARRVGPDAPIHAGPLPFSRAQVFDQAFALLGQPYGWGGRDGHRDCSRYTYDLFAQFGVRLARNSSVQAKLGTRSVDVSALAEEQKREAIRAAAREGVVLLYMPGHIMLYLGHDGDHDYGISALSEYLTPCPGGDDTIHRLDQVALTTLELGRGTERSAFIERITRLAVFGPAPD